MTTKFAKNKGIQRKPPICKAPPEPMPIDPPPWFFWQPDADLVWLDDVASEHLETAALFPMTPGPGPNSFTATVDAPPFTIEVNLTNNPTTLRQTAQLIVHKNGIPVNIRTIENFEPRSMQPYDSGLLLFGDYPNTQNVKLRIMS